LFLQPHDHNKKVAKFYYATPELVTKAIDTSLEAKKEWAKVPIEERMKMFLEVADKVKKNWNQKFY
jgi:1-pyrroline-5-carboxylate dehydrogenase